MRNRFKAIVLSLLLLSPLTAFGADIGRGMLAVIPDDNSVYIYLDGDIVKGDFDKLVELLKEQPTVNQLSLNSPGGDVIEAMKIGNYARDYLLDVFVADECNSACFLLLAGAVKRSAGKPQTIGLHRPVYEKQYFSNLSTSEAAKEYESLDEKVRNYLIEMNIPTHIIDTMMVTPSDRASLWNGEEILNEIGYEAPAYHEWIVSNCGSMTEEEERDVEYLRALDDYKITSKYFPEMETEHETMDKFAIMTAKTFPKDYTDYLVAKLKILAECIAPLLTAERKKIINTIR